MSTANKLLGCALIALSFIGNATSATRSKPKRMTIENARRVHDMKLQQKQQYTNTPQEKGHTVIPIQHPGSLIELTEGKLSDTKEHKGYEFRLTQDKSSSTGIIGVYRDGSQICYSRALHDSLKNGMKEDLVNIINNNIIDGK